MKKINAKRVLSELLAEYNENAEAAGYYKAIKDTATQAECEYAKSCIYSVIQALFKEDVDFTSTIITKTAGNVTFTYYERTAIA
jgi:hypothetical protein